jgi:hypothetical protein
MALKRKKETCVSNNVGFFFVLFLFLFFLSRGKICRKSTKEKREREKR